MSLALGLAGVAVLLLLRARVSEPEPAAGTPSARAPKTERPSAFAPETSDDAASASRPSERESLATSHTTGAPPPDSPASSPAPLDPDEPGRVFVRLVDAAGHVLADANAIVVARSDPESAIQAERIAPGAFELRELAPGSWWISASAPGRADAAQRVELADAHARIELTLALDAIPLVRIALVTPDGRAFADARPPNMRVPSAFAARELPSGSLSASLGADLRDACGSFVSALGAALPTPYIGAIELRCEPPLWVALRVADLVIDAQRLETGVDELRFVLDPVELARAFASLSLRVVDAKSGERLESVTVSLHAGGEPYLMHGGPGSVRFEGIPPGSASFTASAEGYADARHELVLQRGEARELGDVPLDPLEKARLTVRVFGAPADASIDLRWCPLEMLDPARTDAPRVRGAKDVGSEIGVDLVIGNWAIWADTRIDSRDLRSRIHAVELERSGASVELVLEALASLELAPSEPAERVTILDAEGRRATLFPLRLGKSATRIELVPGVYELVSGDAHRIVDLPPSGASVRFE